MGTYEFEIQCLIKVQKQDTNINEAKIRVMQDLESGFLDTEFQYKATVSDGREVKD